MKTPLTTEIRIVGNREEKRPRQIEDLPKMGGKEKTYADWKLSKNDSKTERKRHSAMACTKSFSKDRKTSVSYQTKMKNHG